ncbi:DNA-directed RNA polymerase II [Encephalitozoon intestinalis ATCC 50506]|uniref:DNA-directed RNA polymerase II n=1 Tax=Encephalitozoon intestinalis (strain ATCC 50506) TaxID=876142 RepID=E0S746_ENCIT|nr:DNA-directed RNA polymerase II [Encephalitozoon intestinalis ATCC 50506]ADM11474.1 DNA-directed RNA polymerase II [Encephalitozoon intestinalis ATCC 50506]UTX45186.1 DNA-directed RNA polymerase II subunit RPB11 [Encephalitozoon intestinalis]
MASTRKVEVNYVGNTRNTIELKIDGETHTLGSLLSEELLEDKRCLFSAYRVEHPTDNHVFLRITADKDCQVKDLLLETLKRIEEDTVLLISQLKGF